MRNWARLIFILLCGYSLLGKTFAYVGVPSAKLFIGDLTLAAFLFAFAGPITRFLLDSLTSATQFSGICWAILLGVCYGLLEVSRGLNKGFSPLTSIEELVVSIYPLYFFAGFWAAAVYPDILRKYIWYTSWGACFYAIAYFAGLRYIKLMMPGTNDVPVFTTPGGGLALLGMTYFEGEVVRLWLPICANVFALLTAQVRSEWLAFSVALILQGALVRKLNRTLVAAAGIALLLLIGLWTNASIPSPEGRGIKLVSAREIVARAVAAVDRDAALEYSPRNADFYAGTVSWRERWWDAIWQSSTQDRETTLLGHGYGFPLSGLVSYLRGIDLRTPHNIFFYALGYTGWIGVVLFFWLQFVIGLKMFQVWFVTGQPFGLVFWTAAVISSFFGDFFEAPQGAIPYYLIAGMVCAELARSNARQFQRASIEGTENLDGGEAERIDASSREWHALVV